jgi:mRNA-degrading endonuclease RelE of RelBE toxin-antitoxin system
MKKISVLSSFDRSIKKMNSQDKSQIAESLEAFNTFLVSGKAPFGFRFKKINHNKYEFRVNIKLRVVVKEEDDTFYLVLAGSHEDVKRYLRSFR